MPRGSGFRFICTLPPFVALILLDELAGFGFRLLLGCHGGGFRCEMRLRITDFLFSEYRIQLELLASVSILLLQVVTGFPVNVGRHNVPGSFISSRNCRNNWRHFCT